MLPNFPANSAKFPSADKETPKISQPTQVSYQMGNHVKTGVKLIGTAGRTW